MSYGSAFYLLRHYRLLEPLEIVNVAKRMPKSQKPKRPYNPNRANSIAAGKNVGPVKKEAKTFLKKMLSIVVAIGVSFIISHFTGWDIVWLLPAITPFFHPSN